MSASIIKKFLEGFGKFRKRGEQEWKEVVIYLHGLSPKGIQKDHDEDYQKLHGLIHQEMEKMRKESPMPENYIGLEWGWGSLEPEHKIDTYLANAETWIGEGILKAVSKQRDWTLNPARLATVGMREMFLYGVTDIMYYALNEGEKSVRTAVFKKILSELKNVDAYYENLSLTFICHSAGSVIAHDFLFTLFNTRKPTSSIVYVPGLKKLRKKAQTGKIRFRRFYTFGSPITPLILRSISVVKRFAEKKTLDPKQIGILPDEKLTDPRWVNFWEKDDILSFPVGLLYGDPPSIEDSHPGISGFLSSAHKAYWENEKLARRIAETY